MLNFAAEVAPVADDAALFQIVEAVAVKFVERLVERRASGAARRGGGGERRGG